MRNLPHIHQTAELAERVLLPGDPGRALRLAQTLLQEPKMLNHNRGLWGYTGTAVADGQPLSIQSTGMGGPSAAIVVSELIELGARRLLRIGTCGGLDPALALGQPIIVREAICADGTSRALGARERVAATAGIVAALQAAPGVALTTGTCVSTDLFYDADELVDGWRAQGALVVEMEAATMLQLARLRGVEAGCVLIVSNMLVGDQPESWVGDERLHEAEHALGQLAVSGLRLARS